MDVDMQPGKYVIAVSGGVDSVALLHYLQQQSGLQLTVAHFDHGIRADSVQDREFVAELAKQYSLPFVYDEGRLGQEASEATARKARYDFLKQVSQAAEAQAIITAHHQDDTVETAIINMLRGTGRKGLTALGDSEKLRRPIMHMPKAALIAYARDQGLMWREDSSNSDEKYLRNYVRKRVLPAYDDENRKQLLDTIQTLRRINAELDALINELLQQNSVENMVDRQWFIGLPHIVAREIMASWLRESGITDFDRKNIERLVVAAKIGKPGSVFDIVLGVRLKIGIDSLALQGCDR